MAFFGGWLKLELNPSETQMIRQYLLGHKPEADRSEVEERLMTDSAAYEELLIVEDELIDEYVRGKLSEADRLSFENYFLQSPQRLEKVRFAKAFDRYVSLTAEQETPASDTSAQQITRTGVFSFWPFQNPIVNYAMAAALIVTIVGVSWLALRSRVNDPGKVFAITLTPGGLTRGDGDIQTVTIPPGTGTARLQLVLPADQSSDYAVRLLTRDGNTVWHSEGLKPTEASGKRLVEVDVAADLLKRDTYRLRLSARSSGPYEEIVSYHFRVAN
jgi:hypothetical protein